MRILLVVYDNGSLVNFFPMGLSYLASALLKCGYEVEIYNQDKFHYPEEHLTDYLNKNSFDAICVSVVAGYYQYRKLLKISDAINKSKNRPFYFIGGHGPSPEPEFFLKKTHADVVVIGEGDITIVELMKNISEKKSFDNVKGIAYRVGENTFVNEERPLIKDLSTISLPAYELFPIDYYRLIRIHPNITGSDFVMPVISGRGCLYKCNFCYRLNKGFRSRANEHMLEEINLLIKDYKITYIAFSDELLVSTEKRAVSFCKMLIKNKIKIKWYCNGRLNIAKKDMLGLMKEAGCVFINYGIESFDDTVLKNMNKVLTTKQIITGVENTIDAGVGAGLNIIWGNIGDTSDTLRKGVDFLLKYDSCDQLRTIRPVTPYPGSPLYDYAIEKGMLKDCEDFYENKHVNSDLLTVNFTDLEDKEFHRCLLEANTKLLTNFSNRRLTKTLEIANKLYLEEDQTFRGFRQH